MSPITPTVTVLTPSTVMQKESTPNWLLFSDLSALDSKYLTLATMPIEQNVQPKQLITVHVPWYLTYHIYCHQKQHSYSSKVLGKLSIIPSARLPHHLPGTKPSMDSNYAELQSDLVDVQWLLNLSTNALPSLVSLAHH